MAQNWFKTTILMAGFVALFGTIGYAIGGTNGMLLAFLVGGGMNFYAYWHSDKAVLRMYGAQEVSEQEAPEFYKMVADLAMRAQMPMPKVYIIHEDQPNAFATGRDPEHAAVAATTGILQLLSHAELRGVMAHELAHVKHRDTLISTVSATLAGAISLLANFAMFLGPRDENGRSNPIAGLLVSILAPLAASVIQMAISRAREFEADKGGALISGDPMALARALAKIEHYARGGGMPTAQAHPETAQMMIINPLGGIKGMSKLFSTHPDTQERIARLEAIARGDMRL